MTLILANYGTTIDVILLAVVVVVVVVMCGDQYDAGYTHSPGIWPFCWWKWKMSGQLIHRCAVTVFQ